jgi:hypothetical protein
MRSRDEVDVEPQPCARERRSVEPGSGTQAQLDL